MFHLLVFLVLRNLRLATLKGTLGKSPHSSPHFLRRQIRKESALRISSPYHKRWVSLTKFTTQGNRELCELCKVTGAQTPRKDKNKTWEQQGRVTQLAARGARADRRKIESRLGVHRKANKNRPVAREGLGELSNHLEVHVVLLCHLRADLFGSVVDYKVPKKKCCMSFPPRRESPWNSSFSFSFAQCAPVKVIFENPTNDRGAYSSSLLWRQLLAFYADHAQSVSKLVCFAESFLFTHFEMYHIFPA